VDAAEDAQHGKGKGKGKGKRGDELPEELARRESRLKKIARARAELEQEAREKAERERAEAEARLAERCAIAEPALSPHLACIEQVCFSLICEAHRAQDTFARL
jgi:hypothetical protein